jgi:hypothetical protein
MPNPLLRAPFGRQQTPAMADPPKERQAPDVIDDIGVQEVVFPYRGTEPHGVAPTEHPTSAPGFNEDTVLADVTPEAPEPEPVPVRIVSQGGREVVQWRSMRAIVDGSQRLIVGRNERRRNLRIRNMNAAGRTVFIAPDSNVTSYDGWPLAPGTELQFTAAQSEVYGVSDDGSQVEVAILSEHAIEL